MFPISLAQLRPLLFGHGLRSDEDEPFQAVFGFFIPHANLLIHRAVES